MRFYSFPFSDARLLFKDNAALFVLLPVSLRLLAGRRRLVLLMLLLLSNAVVSRPCSAVGAAAATVTYDDHFPSDSNPTDSTHHDISPELKAEMVKFELSYPESQESRPISDVAEEILKNEDFHYDVDYQHNCKILHALVSVENAKYRLLISISEERQQILVLVRSFTNVPKDRRSAVAEYFTRANYCTRIGNFEMDYRDGEVEYRGSLDLKNTELVPDMLMRLIHLTTLTMDHYFPGLMDVIYGGKSPADAIAEAFNADDDDDDGDESDYDA